MSADLKIVGAPEPEEEAVNRLLGEMSREPTTEIPLALETRGIAAIEGAMIRGRSGNGQFYGVMGALAVAAGVAFAWMSNAEEFAGVAEVAAAHGSVETRTDGAWSALTRGAVLAEGTSVRTGVKSGAEFAMKSDVTVSMKESSELSWPDAAAKNVHLARGSAAFQVEPLPKGEFFSVRAGAATVTVHGTAFSVTLVEEAASPCVVVTEGLVEVKNPDSKIWVSAGQSTGCGLAQEAEFDDKSAQPREAETRQPKKTASRIVRPAQVRPEASNLEEQNKLFQAALVAEQNGDLGGARRRLDQFLTKYPESPLASQVRAQRASLNKRK